MRKLIVTLFCALFTLAATPAFADTQGNTLAEATDFFQSYLDAYNAFSPADASQNYDEKIVISGIGPTLMRSSREEMAAILGTFLGQLKAQGVVSFKWSNLQVRLLNATTAIASNTAVRFKADGELHSQAKATFLAHKTDAGWKIYALTIHSKGTDLTFGQ